MEIWPVLRLQLVFPAPEDNGHSCFSFCLLSAYNSLNAFFTDKVNMPFYFKLNCNKCFMVTVLSVADGDFD